MEQVAEIEAQQVVIADARARRRVVPIVHGRVPKAMEACRWIARRVWTGPLKNFLVYGRKRYHALGRSTQSAEAVKISKTWARI